MKVQPVWSQAYFPKIQGIYRENYKNNRKQDRSRYFHEHSLISTKIFPKNITGKYLQWIKERKLNQIYTFSIINDTNSSYYFGKLNICF